MMMINSVKAASASAENLKKETKSNFPANFLKG